MSLPASFTARPIAHRALHGPASPENSRAAIEAAISHGYGIEIDLQLSKDGAAMVFHDYDLRRLTGQSGVTRSRDAAELAQIRLLNSEETIPHFGDILDLVAGQVPLLVELKDQDGAMGPALAGLEEAAAKPVRDYAGDLAFMSFNPHSCARMAALCPERPAGLVSCGYHAADWPHIKADRRAELGAMRDFAASRAAFISHCHTDLAQPEVQSLKQAGVPILCWTIRSEAEAEQARAIADNITFENFLA